MSPITKTLLVLTVLLGFLVWHYYREGGIKLVLMALMWHGLTFCVLLVVLKWISL